MERAVHLSHPDFTRHTAAFVIKGWGGAGGDLPDKIQLFLLFTGELY